jgi:hypothetical protein
MLVPRIIVGNSTAAHGGSTTTGQHTRFQNKGSSPNDDDAFLAVVSLSERKERRQQESCKEEVDQPHLSRLCMRVPLLGQAVASRRLQEHHQRGEEGTEQQAIIFFKDRRIPTDNEWHERPHSPVALKV